MEVDTNVTNQEAASSEKTSGETVATVPAIVVNEVLTETTNQEAATNQETATKNVVTTTTNQETAASQETAKNIVVTVDMATTNQELQSNWEEVSVDVEKRGRSTTTKSFIIQATPHRNVSLVRNKEQEEIEAKLTATL